jgi:hypothetical protein
MILFCLSIARLECKWHYMFVNCIDKSHIVFTLSKLKRLPITWQSQHKLHSCNWKYCSIHSLYITNNYKSKISRHYVLKKYNENITNSSSQINSYSRCQRRGNKLYSDILLYIERTKKQIKTLMMKKDSRETQCRFISTSLCSQTTSKDRTSNFGW